MTKTFYSIVAFSMKYILVRRFEVFLQFLVGPVRTYRVECR
jgi:hypothetical protein